MRVELVTPCPHGQTKPHGGRWNYDEEYCPGEFRTTLDGAEIMDSWSIDDPGGEFVPVSEPGRYWVYGPLPDEETTDEG